MLGAVHAGSCSPPPRAPLLRDSCPRLQSPSATARPMSRMSLAPEEKATSFPAIFQASCALRALAEIRGHPPGQGATMPGHLQEGFGCVVTNRFDQLFDDESDPFEVLKAAENKKKEAAAAGGAQAKSAAQAAKQPKKESQKDRRNPLPDKKDEPAPPVALKKEGIRRVGRRPDQQQQPPQQQPSQAPQGEGKPIDRRQTDRRPPRERRFEKPAEEKGEGGGEFSVDRPIGDRPPRGRGGPGGRGRGGRGRGIGRGDGFDSRGKREFDRHSGSDRAGPKHEDKRGGSGSHNWGTVKDELSELDQSAVTEEPTETEEQPVVDSENKENEVEGEGPKEEGPKEMTLDEWKAMQDKARSKVEFNIRKPNEGADGQWKKGFVLHKSKSEEVHAESEGLDHHFRKPANDITSQLEINFGDLGRPGRGRGGGRGGRGRGGRGARGGRPDKVIQSECSDVEADLWKLESNASAPDVDDPEAFPALA